MTYHSAKSNLEDFYKNVPKKCLPEEYGGELPSAAELHEKTMGKFLSLKPYFDAEEEQWSDYYNCKK